MVTPDEQARGRHDTTVCRPRPSTLAHPCLGREGIVVDPNATLTAIRTIVKKTYIDPGATTGDLAQLVDLVEALVVLCHDLRR